MSKLLPGKIAVVTGAASGNGRAIARTFAREGADVVVADVREHPRGGGTPTHEIIAEETDATAEFVHCDVTNVRDLYAAVATADDRGGLDIMVNNAGVVNGDRFLDVDEESFDFVMDVNVKGVFFGSQAASEKMVSSGGGTILNMSSVMGLRGIERFTPYCASKGAVRLLTYALAAELGPDGVRVNAIHPGIIETQMTTSDVPLFGSTEDPVDTPIGRPGRPEDVANAALYLASDAAGHVNGASLTVDGGMNNSL